MEQCKSACSNSIACVFGRLEWNYEWGNRAERTRLEGFLAPTYYVMGVQVRGARDTEMESTVYDSKSFRTLLTLLQRSSRFTSEWARRLSTMVDRSGGQSQAQVGRIVLENLVDSNERYSSILFHLFVIVER
jgi:hypothetical protein